MSIVHITLSDGESFGAYVARPATIAAEGAPVIVVIQEIFGVNAGIRGKCDWLAAEGFIAIAPDLFWRLEEGVDLSDKTQAEWDKAFDLMNRFDIDTGVRDLQAVIDYARGIEGSNGKVGCMGYCLGGKVAYLVAARTDVDASVGYYGVGLDELLSEANNIQKPLILHIAGQDKFVPKEAQEKIIAGLKPVPHVTTYLYEDNDHAFTRVGGDHYDAEAAAVADGRTTDFFKKTL